MRKESATVQKCKRQMATLGFDSQLAYHRVKLILKIYRDVVWVLSERMEELHEYAWELGAQDADTGLIYLQSFAPDPPYNPDIFHRSDVSALFPGSHRDGLFLFRKTEG